jgi:hypothetical protein
MNWSKLLSYLIMAQGKTNVCDTFSLCPLVARVTQSMNGYAVINIA